MSEPTPFQFAVIYVEDPDNDGSFLKLCGIQTTGFNSSLQTNDRQVRDCDFPGRPPERKIRIQGRSRTLTGSGIYNVDLIDLFNVLQSGTRTYRFTMMDLSDPDNEAGDEVGTWQGPGLCTQLNIGGAEGEDGTVDITIESDGAWTWTAAA